MEQMSINKNEVSRAIVWKYSERLLSQIINLLVQIILARCLEPSLFGELAILLVFVNVATLFVQSGMGTYIIRKENLDDEDFSLVFLISFTMSLVMYGILFLCAPLVANFYESSSLCDTLRVISISLIPCAICSSYQGLLARRMAFKTIFIRSMISIPISGVIGIVLAKKGAGLWSLVVQHLSNQILTCLVLIIGTKQRIRFKISWLRIKEIIVFGGNILAQSLLIQSVESLRTLVIGKRYSSEELAYYDKGSTYTNYIYSGISMTLSSVLLPTLSRVQNNVDAIKSISRRFLSVSMFVVTPIMVGFAITANNWVPVLLTDKWVFAVPFIIVLSLSRIAGPITTVHLQIYYAMGKVHVSRRIVLIECILSIIVLFITYRISTIAVAYGYIAISIFDIFLFSFPNKKYIGYTWRELFVDFLPTGIGAIIMSIGVALLNLLPLPTIVILVFQVFLGVLMFLLFAVLIRNPSYIYLKNSIIGFLNHKKNKNLG